MKQNSEETTPLREPLPKGEGRRAQNAGSPPKARRGSIWLSIHLSGDQGDLYPGRQPLIASPSVLEHGSGTGRPALCATATITAHTSSHSRRQGRGRRLAHALRQLARQSRRLLTGLFDGSWTEGEGGQGASPRTRSQNCSAHSSNSALAAAVVGARAWQRSVSDRSVQGAESKSAQETWRQCRSPATPALSE